MVCDRFMKMLGSRISEGSRSVSKAFACKDFGESSYADLSCGLEREIKARFDESRPYGIPQWNLLACRCYSMVQFCLFLRKSLCDMCSLRYVSVERLVEVVMRTKIHVNSEHTTQFALAVHIQAYMNNKNRRYATFACKPRACSGGYEKSVFEELLFRMYFYAKCAKRSE
uniref:Uncharacterized protein n=1 Tax=Parascaris equorum TaxID=6256 RepID=A0A914R981_PAREQ